MRKSRRTRARSGFTILELLIVMVAIAIVASLAVPSWFDRGEVTLDNAARLLARDLRDAQNRATYDGLALSFIFREDGDGYEVRNVHGELLPAPMGGGPFVRKYSHDAIFRGVNIVRTNFGEDRTLVYNDQGLASEGGSVVLCFDDEARVVAVEEMSGLIEIKGLAEAWFDNGR